MKKLIPLYKNYLKQKKYLKARNLLLKINKTYSNSYAFKSYCDHELKRLDNLLSLSDHENIEIVSNKIISQEYILDENHNRLIKSLGLNHSNILKHINSRKTRLNEEINRILYLSNQNRNTIINLYLSYLKYFEGIRITCIKNIENYSIQETSIIFHSHDLIIIDDLEQSLKLKDVIKITSSKINFYYYLNENAYNIDINNYVNKNIFFLINNKDVEIKTDIKNKYLRIENCQIKDNKVNSFTQITNYINNTFTNYNNLKILYSINNLVQVNLYLIDYKSMYLFTLINTIENLSNHKIVVHIDTSFNSSDELYKQLNKFKFKNINKIYTYKSANINESILNIKSILNKNNDKTNQKIMVLLINFSKAPGDLKEFKRQNMNLIGDKENTNKTISILLENKKTEYLLSNYNDKYELLHQEIKSYKTEVIINEIIKNNSIIWFNSNQNFKVSESKISTLKDISIAESICLYNKDNFIREQSHLKYKNIHLDKDIYIICSGPSLNYINNNFFKDKICIGINYANKRINCKYSIFKEYPSIELESKLKKQNTIIFASLFKSGNKKKGNIILNKDCFRSPSVNYFEHHQNTHTQIDFSIINKLDTHLIVSWSTVTSGIHLAAYMGARNIILVGHDCGYINGKSNIEEHTHRSDGVIDNWNASQKDYLKWLNDIENQTILVRDELAKQNITVLSINPFVGLSLEGNEFTNYKTKKEEQYN